MDSTQWENVAQRLPAGGSFHVQATVSLPLCYRTRTNGFQHAKLVMFSAAMLVISTWGAVASTIGSIGDDGHGWVVHGFSYVRQHEGGGSADAAVLVHMWLIAAAEYPALITTLVLLSIIEQNRRISRVGFILQVHCWDLLT